LPDSKAIRAADAKAIRALVVDDQPDTREMLARFFRAEGVEVEEAADGGQAVRAFARAQSEGRPFDLVVLDLAMPRVDGGTAAQMIRGLEGERRAWIEGYTGHAEEVEEVQSFVRAGIDRLTEKPGDPEAWVQLIHRLVSQRQG
jgi:CheY-like chemotaxis protein